MTPSKCLICISPDCDDNCIIIRNENAKRKYLSKPENREIQRKAVKRWKDNNRKACVDYSKKYYLKNIDKVREDKKEWYRREKI